MHTWILQIATVVTLAMPTAGDPAEVGVGLGCAGGCAGASIGYSIGTKKCADMTAAEITALKQAACAKTSKDDARSNANETCDDGSGTCLCAGGAFTAPKTNTGDKNGKCEANCGISYQGNCKVVPVPVEAAVGPVPVAAVPSFCSD
ncbi:MAG: hypothetical protein MI919_42595 [Holophagales bacterium]|nr:hypothetical protein [Holophagales bacterium]